MSQPMTIIDFLKSLATVSSVGSLLSVDGQGNLQKPQLRNVISSIFASVSNSDDLDNPTTKGVFNVNQDTPITRPTKGSGWQFGYVINLAITSGIQVWFNFDGYIAVRGKGSSGGTWSDWAVMAKMT